jgi:hypothetical protein
MQQPYPVSGEELLTARTRSLNGVKPLNCETLRWVSLSHILVLPGCFQQYLVWRDLYMNCEFVRLISIRTWPESTLLGILFGLRFVVPHQNFYTDCLWETVYGRCCTRFLPDTSRIRDEHTAAKRSEPS